MKKLTLLLLFVLSAFFLLSCKKSALYEEKVTFLNANWAFENKIVMFSADMKGSEKPYTIIIELDLIGVPNVDKINAVFTMTTPKGGKTMKSVVFNFQNPQEPYIIKNSKEKTYRLTVYPKKYFPETGTYTFEVNQLSHKADNYGIRSLKLRIEKAKE